MPWRRVPPPLSVSPLRLLSLFLFLIFSQCLEHTEKASGHPLSFAIAGSNGECGGIGREILSAALETKSHLRRCQKKQPV